MLGDLDYHKKQEIQQRRKQRLGQVRQQSKLLAQHVREKVQAEKKRQQACMDRRKDAELKLWQQRNVEKLEREYEKCLKEVGKAHVAAADYEEKENLHVAKRMAQRAAAAKRGIEAADKLRCQQKPRKKTINKLKQKTVSIQTQVFESESEEEWLEKEPPLTKTIISSDDEDEIKILSDMTSGESEEKRLKQPEPSYDQPQSNYRSIYEGPFRQISELLQRKTVDSPCLTEREKYPILDKPRSITEKVKLGSLYKSPQKTRPQMATPKFQPTTQRILGATERRKTSVKTPQKSHGDAALEREAIRKDYDDLAQRLDKLCREERHAKAYGTAEYNFSMDKIASDLKKKQTKMENAFEKLASRQSVITCPKVRSMEPERKKPVPSINVGDIHTFNRPPKKTTFAPDPDPELNRIVNIEKLRDLLERINEQKQQLLFEIEKTKVVPNLNEYNVQLKNLEGSFVRAKGSEPVDRTKLIQEKAELEKKELKLLNLEKKIEARMRELYEKTKSEQKVTAEAAVETASSTDSEDVRTIEAKAPVKIVIKVSEGGKICTRKEEISDDCGKVFPKTPKKITPPPKPAPKPVSKPVPKEVPKQGILKNPVSKPPTQHKDVDKMLVDERGTAPVAVGHKSPQEVSAESGSTIYRSPPPTMKTEFSKYLNRLAQKGDVQRGMPKPLPAKPDLNPSLEQYIKRLLGMSRKEVQELGVTSGTDIDTPNSTIVNVPENRSIIDSNHIARMKDFIRDNRSFVSEVNKKLDSTKLTGSQEQNESIVEGVWLDLLEKKRSQMQKPQKVTRPRAPPASKKPKTSSPKPEAVKAPPKPAPDKALPKQPTKAPAKPPVPHSPQTQIKSNINQIIGEVELLRVSGKNESEILDKYAELTKTCSARIADLTKLIEKARVDKKMTLELSFASDVQHSTEYLDVPQRKTLQDDDRTTPDTTSFPEPSEEIGQIYRQNEKMKNIGKSKDSGIGSRPVTSSEMRDSTEQMHEEKDGGDGAEKLQIDLEKFGNALDYLTAAIAKGEKKKPPASIKRFSPQLPDKPTHELSTIVEVDTSASKLNVSKDPDEGASKLTETLLELDIMNFPDFEEYVKALSKSHNLDLEDTQKLRELLYGSMNPDQLQHLQVQKFPSFQHDSDDSREKYEKIIQDIGGELRRRKIIDRSVVTGEGGHESDASTVSSGSLLNIGPVVAQTLDQLKPQLEVPESPKKKQKLDETLPKTPRRSPKKRQRTPKKFPVVEPLPADVALAEEIDQLGLNWGASTVRRTEAANALVSSSSGQDDELIRKCIENGTKQPKHLSLKQFFQKELVSRSPDFTITQNESLASQFLRSLLNMTSSSSSGAGLNREEMSKFKRTSTPVASRSLGSSSSRPHSSKSPTRKLFSSGSSISSVHASSSDERQQLNKVTLLPPPKLEQEADNYASSSTPSSNA